MTGPTDNPCGSGDGKMRHHIWSFVPLPVDQSERPVGQLDPHVHANQTVRGRKCKSINLSKVNQSIAAHWRANRQTNDVPATSPAERK